MWSLVAALACTLPHGGNQRTTSGDSGDVETTTDLDADGDGFDAPLDCDDADATVHPYAPEVCGNGKDDNCVAEPEGCEWSGRNELAGLVLSSPDSLSEPTVCDANGDGQLDVAVSSLGANDKVGAVHVFYGPVLSDRTAADADYTLEGTNASLYLGGIDCRNDVDGDGIADLFVSAYGLWKAGLNGAAYLVPGGGMGHGSIDDDATSAWLSNFEHVANGHTVVGFDQDGNGRDDLAVTFSMASGDPSWSSRTYVIAAPTPGVQNLESASVAYVYSTDDFRMSAGWGNAGDLDGDGIEELAFAGRDRSYDSDVIIVRGPLTGAISPEDADVRIEEMTFESAGVARVDLDSDGQQDLVLGNAAYENDAGAVYGFLGQLEGDAVADDADDADVRIYGATPSDQFGWSVASAGDGSGALLIGAPNAEANGVIYLIQSGAPGVYDGPGNASASWSSERTLDAGSKLNGGEVTGDTIDDFLIRATNVDGVGASAAIVLLPSFDL